MGVTLIDPTAMAIIEELQRQNAELRTRIAELEAKLARYEGRPPPDPSTPSGMTAPFHKKNKKRKGKKPGRKGGHPGARRTTTSEPNNHEHHALGSCPDCGLDLELKRVSSTRTRTTEDIPTTPDTEHTRHTVESKWCPRCKKRVEARVDAALPRCTLGLRVVLLTAWMHYSLGTTANAITKYLERVHNFVVTVGGLTQAWSRLAKALESMHAAIWEDIRHAGVLHVDETGWRVCGQTYWLWCFTTKSAAFYVIDRTRGSPVVMRILGQSFGGVLVTDFFAAYNFICAAAKQKCLAHLLRELEKVSLRNGTGEWKVFAAKSKRLLQDALRLGLERSNYGDAEFERRWKRLYDRLGDIHDADYRDKDCCRLARRLAKYRLELFTFLEQESVDATNNHGERTIRPAVLMRKNYGGNRSERGAEVQAALMSIFRTLEMRGVDPLAHLERQLRDFIARDTEPVLPVASSSVTESRAA